MKRLTLGLCVMLLAGSAVAASPARKKSGVHAAHREATRPAATRIVAPPSDPFQAAGAAYEAGRFAEAQAAWERLGSEQGLTPELCYNLGNTAYRLGHRGLAIIWFERARRLAPRDEDIRFNLSVMRSTLQDENASGWETPDRLLTVRDLAWLVTALVWVLGIGCGWALWADWEWVRWRRLVLWGLPVLIVAAAWLGLREQDLAANWSVTVAPTVEVRSGPGDQFAVGFTVPEGTRALILNQRPGWIELGVPAKSLKGWVPDDAVVKI